MISLILVTLYGILLNLLLQVFLPIKHFVYHEALTLDIKTLSCSDHQLSNSTLTLTQIHPSRSSVLVSLLHQHSPVKENGGEEGDLSGKE